MEKVKDETKNGAQDTPAAPEETPQQKIQKANAEMIMALQQEKKQAWEEISATLTKYNMAFSCSMTHTHERGIQYIVDLIKRPPQS